MTEPAQPNELPYRPCVGVMLLNRQGLIFVGQRIDQTVEAWQMPQGGIDEGETPRQAAVRELEEETSISRAEFLAESSGWLNYDLPPHLVGKVWRGRYRGQRQKWFAMRFTGRDEDIDLETAHPEFEVWRWLPVDQLCDSIVPFKRDVYARVVEEFRHLAE